MADYYISAVSLLRSSGEKPEFYSSLDSRVHSVFYSSLDSPVHSVFQYVICPQVYTVITLKQLVAYTCFYPKVVYL
jgi:hypothetical protein